MSDNTIYEGTIEQWFDKGIAAGFGFISYDNMGARLQHIFFNQDGISEDNIGRCSFAKIVGNLVRFRLEKYVYRGAPSTKAVDIVSVFSTDVADPEAHREVSVVDSLVRSPKGSLSAVFLRRSSGDQLYLSREGVADQYKHLFQSLWVGRHVWSGVKPPLVNEHSWSAIAAEFYSAEEEEAMCSSSSLRSS